VKSSKLLELLKEIENGSISAIEAQKKLGSYNFVDVDSITLDLSRQQRNGTPEVIYSETKTDEQLTSISEAYKKRNVDALFSRLQPKQLQAVESVLFGGRYNKSGRTFLWRSPTSKLPLDAPSKDNKWGKDKKQDKLDDLTNSDSIGFSDTSDSLLKPDLSKVIIVSAGSSDAFVVDEISETLFFVYGQLPTVISDCGVAGIHRILSYSEVLAGAKAIVAVAGMDGALPTVVAGLTKAPVIAVPTSVGYGPLGNGIAPLIGMLSSCAPGLVVVNVDNGIGAAFAVCRMVRG